MATFIHDWRQFMCNFFYKSLFLITLLAYFSTGSANDAYCCQRLPLEEALVVDDKIYLDPTSVYIAANGIFVNIQDEVIAVGGLFSDDHGIYFLLSEYHAKRENGWICIKCGWKNNDDRAWCANCNRFRG